MGPAILLFLLADAVFLVSFVLLIIAAFRIKIFYGFAVMFLPFSSLIFAVRYWKEVGGKFLVNVASYVAMLLILGTSPELMQRVGHKLPGATLVARAWGTPDAPPPPRPPGSNRPGTAPRAVRDLAENEASPAPVQTADPFAAQRAACVRHGAELAAEYQQLNADRAKLKPGSPAVAAFNVRAARYQSGLQALQAEKAQLAALDHPAAAPGQDVEANAALARLRTTVDQGDYAAFAAQLRKCLADYHQTAAYPQIVALGRQVLRNAPPTRLAGVLQQQARDAQTEYNATTQKVQAIVNQTPTPLDAPPHSREIYKYGYHPGAAKPDFNTADVLSGREPWKGDYVYIDVKPGVFYRSADCEFNAQTKFFYTSRDVPKKKLTDAENQEVVRLYRILGKDEAILNALPQRLAEAKNTSADLVALNTQLGGGK